MERLHYKEYGNAKDDDKQNSSPDVINMITVEDVDIVLDNSKFLKKAIPFHKTDDDNNVYNLVAEKLEEKIDEESSVYTKGPEN